MFFVIPFLCTNIHAQNQKQPKEKTVDSLLALTRQAVLKADVVQTLVYAYQVLSISESINFSEGKIKAYFYIGQALVHSGNSKETIHYLTLSSKEPYTKNNAMLKAEISRVQGRLYLRMAYYKQAIEEFNKGLQYIQSLKNKQIIKQYESMIYENMVNVYKMQNQWDSAYYYIKKQTILFKSIDEALVFYDIVNHNSLLGAYYVEMKQADSAIYHFKKGIAISEKYNYPYTSYIYTTWGDMEAERGNNDLALNIITRH